MAPAWNEACAAAVLLFATSIRLLSAHKPTHCAKITVNFDSLESNNVLRDDDVVAPAKYELNRINSAMTT